MRAASHAHQTADGSGADDRDAIADVRAGVPDAVDRGLEIGGQHGALRRHVVGQHVHRLRRHDVAGLMRIEDEHRPILQLARTALDPADARVAVLDRRREVARLKRRAHARAFALRARGR